MAYWFPSPEFMGFWEKNKLCRRGQWSDRGSWKEELFVQKDLLCDFLPLEGSSIRWGHGGPVRPDRTAGTRQSWDSGPDSCLQSTHATHCARSGGWGGKPSRACNRTQSWSLRILFVSWTAWVLQTPELEIIVTRSHIAFAGLYLQTLSWLAQTFRSQGKK